MTVVRTFTPDEVERFQPRAKHFYHQHGSWDGGLYTVWVGEQWAAFKAEHGIDERWGSSVEIHERFTAWISDRCSCQTPGALTPGPGAPSIPPGG